MVVMPVLSIRQPWAWLIVNGYKDIENRDWPTKLRGDFLVHAGKAMDDMSLDEIINCYGLEGVDPVNVELNCGGIVGRSTIIDCVTRSDSKWFHGKYGFELGQSSPLPFLPCRGRLGFFTLKNEMSAVDGGRDIPSLPLFDSLKNEMSAVDGGRDVPSLPLFDSFGVQ